MVLRESVSTYIELCNYAAADVIDVDLLKMDYKNGISDTLPGHSLCVVQAI